MKDALSFPMVQGAKQNESIKHCKLCGGQNLHPLKIQVLSAPDEYEGQMLEIKSLQEISFHPVPVKTMNRNRELSFKAFWDCENCGSIFWEYFAFHKGSTYVTTELDADLTLEKKEAFLAMESEALKRAELSK